MGNQLSFFDFEECWDTFALHDDFEGDVDTFRWVVTASDSGSALVGDATKGILTILPSDGSVGDNDETYISSVNELFLFAAGKPMTARALIQYTEINTDDANIIFGFMNAAVADSIGDAGAGPRATGSLAVIYKVDGGTVWRCQSRNGSEVTDSISTTTAGGSAWTTLEIIVHDYTTTRAQITYKVDGVFLKDSNNVVIKHTLLVAAATEMDLVIGVKNGDTTLETLLVDKIMAKQLR